jgi:uncharacterized protein Usg
MTMLNLTAPRMTTAEIVYHLPDHPHVLQSFVWQQLDVAPDFPGLKKFLEFWSRSLDGKLHSVNVAQAVPSVRSGRFCHVRHSFSLH